MKDYFLKPPPLPPPLPSPTGHAASFDSHTALLRRTSAELKGICKAMLFDGNINQAEAVGLRAWIARNPTIREDVVAACVIDRVARIFADGVADAVELTDLQALLEQFAGEPGKPVSLPLDNPPPDITIPGRSFCFTGKFICGSRSWCEKQVQARGGMALPTVVRSLNCLVIGSVSSPLWANGSYGTKIESAVSFRDINRIPIAIVSEDRWLAHLLSIQP